MRWWWLAAATLCWGAPARAEVVDRLVAVVGAEPLLASQVAVDRALAPIDPAPVPFWTLAPAPGAAGVDADTQRAIDAVVLRQTAADVALYQPTREQVVARIEALRATFGDDDRAQDRWEGFLAARGLDEARLDSVMRRRMVTERFLLRNLVAAPTDPAWPDACREAVAALRERMRIRIVPEPAPGAP
ncbi:MAG: hypothetical protein R3F59_10195 [Myxococcota bacterium]